MTEKIGFIGLGKLGLPAAEVFSQHYQVSGFDVCARQSDTVNVCDAQSLIQNNDWIFIAVPTPHAEGYDGSLPSSHLEPRDFDHDAVLDAIDNINVYANTSKKIVLISTVLPGTTRHKFVTRLDPRHQFLYNPYLIAMGSVKWDMVNPEMVMIGTCDGDRTALAGELIDLYRPMMENNPRYVVGTWDECEAIKIFYNTFISAKVGLANMIQDFAMKIGNINVDVVTDALAQSTMRIMGPKYMTAGMGDAGACHPRDNIALRWLAQEYAIGYDIFDTIMHAREIQASNLADFLIEVSDTHQQMPIVIHGKTYKPNVPYCIGSYSTLIAHFILQKNRTVQYLDPLADDTDGVTQQLHEPSVILMAHNTDITYAYTGKKVCEELYTSIPDGSILVDPWRRIKSTQHYTAIHYGNTRTNK